MSCERGNVAMTMEQWQSLTHLTHLAVADVNKGKLIKCDMENFSAELSKQTDIRRLFCFETYLDNLEAIALPFKYE